jgi:hypothetical protein
VAFAEYLSPLLADFGVDATLAAAPLRAIVDTESLVEIDGVLSQRPSALVISSAAPSAAAGQAFVANSTTYTVRQVLREPPDGALTRLVLSR